jgi:hypothetical protein
MRWRHPIEKKDLKKYYIWLDTEVVNDSAQNVSKGQIDKADANLAYSSRGENDSLDLTDLISKFLERDSLHIAIWAEYSGSEKGAVQHIYAHFGDDIPPSIVDFRDSAASNSIWIYWTRPTDQRDFYSPNEINGPIAGYNISVEAINRSDNVRSATVKADLSGNPVNVQRFYRFKKEGRGVVLEEDSNANPYFLRFALLDGKGFASDDIQANSWKVEVSDLKPEHSYIVTIVAYDSAGNQSKPQNRTVATTDTIPPLIANEFWLYKDLGDGLPRLDSNRLILFWPRSVDPLHSPHGIKLDSRLHIPENYHVEINYMEVRKYSIEQWNGASWEPIQRDSVVLEDYYNARYRLESDSMIFDKDGEFISDTLRWVLPGDTIKLRIRAIDNSGYYSEAWVETIVVSKGELWQHKCPANFVPVKMDSSVFCMEKLQHISGNKFERNVLYIKAKEICKAQGHHLCTEQEWYAACTTGVSRYGVIEERDFSPDKFLFGYCGVGTGDSISANSIAGRKKICANRSGVRDLPGQLQEWVTGKGEDSGEIPLLKGSSYAIFNGASRVELAQCRNKFTPTRIRPRCITDTVWLYRSGSRIDTLLSEDTLRGKKPHDILPPEKFTDTILVYTIKSLDGDSLGFDYVDKKECRRRNNGKDCLGELKTDWLEELWKGLKYEPKEERQVFIFGTENVKVLISGTDSVAVSNLFLDPTVGFRCCAQTTME